MLLLFCIIALFVLGARTAVVGVGVDGDAATWGEEAGDLDVFGIHQFDEVLHDDVDTILMEIAVVAEAKQVKLQALALHHSHVGDVTDADFRKIGLPGDGAEAGELGAVELHPIVVALMLVDEGLQSLFFSCLHIIKL